MVAISQEKEIRLMPLPAFLTFWKTETAKERAEARKKKKKKKSLRDVKFVRHGEHEKKKQIMDEALDI